jgi:hypothetical protein
LQFEQSIVGDGILARAADGCVQRTVGVFYGASKSTFVWLGTSRTPGQLVEL